MTGRINLYNKCKLPVQNTLESLHGFYKNEPPPKKKKEEREETVEKSESLSKRFNVACELDLRNVTF